MAGLPVDYALYSTALLGRMSGVRYFMELLDWRCMNRHFLPAVNNNFTFNESCTISGFFITMVYWGGWMIFHFSIVQIHFIFC